MYLSFYGLKKKPFQNSTHLRFFWLGGKQQEALTIFKYGISKMSGILLLTGDVGTGKTMLINALLDSLGDQFIIVKVLDPDLDRIEFMNYISDALDFKKKFASKDTFFAHFSHFLEKSAALGKKVILVIDECQRLNSQLLNEILKLANIEKGDTKLLKVILIGQNEFNDVLQKNKSSALYKFIAINYAIAPLDLNETDAFIRHRLKIAGAQRDIFNSDAISRIHEFSGGIPRRINILCDHALLFGFAQETTTINGKLIEDCAKDLRPRDYLHPPENEPTKSAAGGSLKKRRRLPESRQKAAAHRPGKTFGMFALITIIVFLITYFTAPMTYRKALDYIYKQGLQVFNNLQGIDTQNRTLISAPAIQKVTSEDIADKDIATISETTVTKEHQTDTQFAKKLPDDNGQPEGEQHKQDIGADGPPDIAGTPSRTDDLPVVGPIDIIKKDATLENVALPPDIPHADKELAGSPDASENGQPAGDQDQQDIAADGLPDIAGTPNRRDDLPVVGPIDTIKKDATLENVALPPVTPHEDNELTTAPDTSGMPATKEIRKAVKDLLERQNATQVDSTTDKEFDRKTQDELKANAKKQDEPSKKQEVLDESPPEPIDPAAIIDWVIKNKGK